ncbi:MAG: S53 family peptidase, partial [Armatimonadota bacterium]|nr:S53 family peptidase [Armatimonadota bacterium]
MNIAARRVALALLLMLTASVGASAQARLQSDYVPRAAMARAQRMGNMASTAPVALALTLPWRNAAQLNELLRRQQDPRDPQFGRYLTPQQFMAQFGPTQSDYNAVRAWARGQGLKITGTHPNRLILDVEGAAQTVQTALAVRLGQYQTAQGRVFRAAENAPQLPPTVAGVAGLNQLAVRRPRAREAFARPASIGSGPRGGLTPADIRKAYNLSSTGLDGTGQTLAVFELADYKQIDIDAYAAQFGLNSVPRQNILVDGGAAVPADGSDEATLDIELQLALAPGASKILVYQGPNSDAGVLDTYNKIATDNIAKQISTSWGSPESTVDAPTLNAEYAIFQQMAAQGQTIYSASGDFGAFDDGKTLSVDDPGSQPFVCAVGGTRLSVTGPGGTYTGETTWNDGSPADGASGGGVSAVWPLPSYQQGVVSAASGGSGTMRNVPDVVLNAAPDTGYAIYYNGGWHV